LPGAPRVANRLSALLPLGRSRWFDVRGLGFSPRGGPDLSEFDDALILKTFGVVPDDFV